MGIANLPLTILLCIDYGIIKEKACAHYPQGVLRGPERVKFSLHSCRTSQGECDNTANRERLLISIAAM